MKVLNASPHHLDTPSVFQDRKMDGPNSINNYSPLTMTPKLLTLQLPMMISTTTTSHNVAHVPSDRNTVLGNKFSTRERGGENRRPPLRTAEPKQPGNAQAGSFVGLHDRAVRPAWKLWKLEEDEREGETKAEERRGKVREHQWSNTLVPNEMRQIRINWNRKWTTITAD